MYMFSYNFVANKMMDTENSEKLVFFFFTEV